MIKAYKIGEMTDKELKEYIDCVTIAVKTAYAVMEGNICGIQEDLTVYKKEDFDRIAELFGCKVEKRKVNCTYSNVQYRMLIDGVEFNVFCEEDETK